MQHYTQHKSSYPHLKTQLHSAESDLHTSRGVAESELPATTSLPDCSEAVTKGRNNDVTMGYSNKSKSRISINKLRERTKLTNVEITALLAAFHLQFQVYRTHVCFIILSPDGVLCCSHFLMPYSDSSKYAECRL